MPDLEFHLAGPAEEFLIVLAPDALTQDAAEDLRITIARHLPRTDNAAAIVDLSATGLISSLGVAALLQAQEFCKDREARFILAALTAQNTRFLKMLHLADRFPTYDSTEAAIEALTA